MPTDISGVLHLVQTYGYLGLFAAAFVAALGIGVPIPLTALLVALGALSVMPHGPGFAGLALAGLAGVCGGHLTDYSVGRFGGRHLSGRLERLGERSRVRRVLDAASRLRGGHLLLVFLSRFLLTSIASPVSLLAGVTQLSLPVYLGLEVVGEALYVLGNLMLGRVFGPHITASWTNLLVLWSVIAVVSLLPVALLRLVTRTGGRGAGISEASTSMDAQAKEDALKS
jgi:membrane protein DedA with SNARE-associated domain